MWKRTKKTKPALWMLINPPPKKEKVDLYALAIEAFRRLSPLNRICFRCWKEKQVRKTSITNHHIRGRLGSLKCNIRFFMSLCLWCHQWVHGHPKKAAEQGYIDLANWNKIP